MPTNEELAYSERHPHEDRGVPPALRPDGGCEVCELEVKLERAVFIAQHLFQMIPQEVWRAEGAEAFGQYEGDHWAEQTRLELEELKAYTESSEKSG